MNQQILIPENSIKYYQLAFPQNAMNLYDAYDLILNIRSGNLVKQYTLNSKAFVMYKFNKDSKQFQRFTDKRLTHNHINDTFLINIENLVFLQNCIISYCLYNVDTNQLSVEYPISVGSNIELNDVLKISQSQNYFILNKDPNPKQKKFINFFTNIKSTYLKNEELEIKVLAKYDNENFLRDITSSVSAEFPYDSDFKINNGKLIAPSSITDYISSNVLTLYYSVENLSTQFNKKFNLAVIQKLENNFLSATFSNDNLSGYKLSECSGLFNVELNYNDQKYNISNDTNLKILTSNNEGVISFNKNYGSLSGIFNINFPTKNVSSDVWFQYQKDNILFTSNKTTLQIYSIDEQNEYNNAKYLISLSGLLTLADKKSSQVTSDELFVSKQKNFYSSMLNSVITAEEDFENEVVDVLETQKDLINGNELYSEQFILNPEYYYDCNIYADINLSNYYDKILTTRIPYNYYFRQGLKYKIQYRNLASNQEAYKIKNIVLNIDKSFSSKYPVSISNLNICNLKENYQILSIIGIFKATNKSKEVQLNFTLDKESNKWIVNQSQITSKMQELKKLKISIAYIPNKNDFYTIEILKNN